MAPINDRDQQDNKVPPVQQLKYSTMLTGTEDALRHQEKALLHRNAIVSRVHARVGLLGNPSDGFYGKTISFSLKNFYAEV